MLVAGKVASSTANGPGDRAVVWFQGCTGMSCKSTCWNPQNHEINRDKTENVDLVLDWILTKAKDGVTFSGGEPMQAVYYLNYLIYWLKEERPELSIGLYTGYSLKELNEGNYKVYTESGVGQKPNSRYWLNIKRRLDFAVMGRFNILQQDTSRPLRSSRNQELVLFSDRYKESDFGSQEIEFHVNDTGLIQITGFPVGLPGLLDEMREW